jgi:phage terminase large subunit-like protein
MVRASNDLKRFAKVLTYNISVPDNYSKFEPLGADTDTLDGLNVHCALVDEVHAHKDRSMWDILNTATGARTQPLIFAITTAGFDRTTLLADLDDYGKKILEGTLEDDGLFPFICTLDDGDDWQDEAVWEKANPNLGVSIFKEDLKAEMERARNTPSSLNSFLRYRLNVWTESEIGWLTPEQWAFNDHGSIDIDKLKGRLCYAGLDLAAKRDTTSLVLVFPPNGDGSEIYTILPYIFVPEGTIYERERLERVPWTMWKRQGLVFTTPGLVTDTRFVLKKLEELDKQFQIGDLVYDRWGMDLVVPRLIEMGWADSAEDQEANRFGIEMGQGWKSMSPATKLLEEMALEGKLSHGGNKVLSWMMSNVALKTDDAENVHPSKKKSTGRIDAIISLMMALWRAKAIIQQEKPRSKYEDQGLLII